MTPKLRHRLRVVAHETLSERVRWVVAEPSAPVPFRAGQFMSLEVAPGGRRAYSIAGDPGRPERLEFLVDIGPGGAGSSRVIGLRPGDEVIAYGPQGGFVLPDRLEGTTVVVGVDVGAAPVRAIALEAAARKDGGGVKTFLVWKDLAPFPVDGPFRFPPRFEPSSLRIGEGASWTAPVAAAGASAAFLCGERRALAVLEETLVGCGMAREAIRTEVFY